MLNCHELSQEAKASETRAKLEDYDPWKIRVHGPVLGAFASLIGDIEFSEIILNIFILHIAIPPHLSNPCQA